MSKNMKKQSAVQFIRKMDNIIGIMEGIAQKTCETENARLESMEQDDLFDIDNLLDVKVVDDEDQPKLSINKPRELTEGDKAQIIEEFANILKRMPNEVIDFSDIGPIGTVIQTKLGFAQSLDGFLKDVISGAADAQNSQAIAKNDGVIPSDVASDVSNEIPSVDKGPADIEPAKETIIDADKPEEINSDIAPISSDVPPVSDSEISLETPAIDPLTNDEPIVSSDVVDNIELDDGIEPSTEDVVEPTTTDTDIVSDDVELEDGIEPSTEDVTDSVEDGNITDDVKVDDKAENKDENKDEDKDEDDKIADDSDDIDFDFDEEQDAQLESIRQSFFQAEKDRRIDAIMEAVLPKKTNSINSFKAKLESIVEAVKHDNKITAQLEATKAEYIKKTEKCKDKDCKDEKCATKYKKKAPKLEATDIKKELDALIESYSANVAASKEKIANRQKARNLIESITK